MSGGSRFDAVVVGAGVAGRAAARSLAHASQRTLLLERFALGHDRGSSHGASRIFRLAYEQPFYIPLCRAAGLAWRELEREDGRELLRLTGGVSAGANADRVAATLGGAGLAFERLDDERLQLRFPGGRFERGAVWQSDAGVVLADDALDALLRSAMRAGCAVRDRAAVARIDDGLVVLESGEEIRAERVVVAAGAWANELLAPLGLGLPLDVRQVDVAYFAEDSVRWRPVVTHKGEAALFGLPDPVRGYKVGLHDRTTPLAHADDRHGAPTEDHLALLRDFVAQHLPALNPAEKHAETCLYTMTPDEDFVLDQVERITIVAACSGHGFKFGPLLGELAADLALGRPSQFDLSPFRRARFAAA